MHAPGLLATDSSWAKLMVIGEANGKDAHTMAKMVSIKELLRTGRLGPLTTELTPNEVGHLMGAPSFWFTGERLPFPDYWHYGRLELCFVRDPAHRERPLILFFLIRFTEPLTGDCVVIPVGGGAKRGLELTVDPETGETMCNPSSEIGAAIVLDLEGLNGQSKVADWLEAMSGCPGMHVVTERHHNGDNYRIAIANGRVEVVFYYDVDEGCESICAGWSDAELSRRVADGAKLESIYCHSERPQPNRATTVERREIPASAFLAALPT